MSTLDAHVCIYIHIYIYNTHTYIFAAYNMFFPVQIMTILTNIGGLGMVPLTEVVIETNALFPLIIRA